MSKHYKQFKTGTPEYKKAYSEHMMKKLKKKRKGAGYNQGYDESNSLDGSDLPLPPN